MEIYYMILTCKKCGILFDSSYAKSRTEKYVKDKIYICPLCNEDVSRGE